MKSAIAQLAGVLMLLSALAHGLMGWPAMSGELVQAGATPDLIAGLRAGWYWGSVSMATFGIITLISAARLRHGNRSGAAALLAIGAGYLLFGTVAFLLHGFEPHFLLFVLTGLLAAGSALATQPRHPA